MKIFRDLYLPVARRMGDISPGAIAVAKEYVNRIMGEIAQRSTWPQLCDEKQFQCVVEYTTGTVTVTLNSYTVAGASTVWTTDMAGRTFTLSGSDIRYKVKSVASATSLTLDHPYKGSTSAGESYRIIHDEYPLERDTIGIIRMNMPEENWNLSPGLMSRYFDVRDHIEEDSQPEAYFAVGATKDPYYATGTVTVAEGGTTVTGSGTTWDSTMINRMIRFIDDQPERLYRISAVGSTTSITLSDTYRGRGGDTLSYEIDPAGIPLVKLYPRPDDDYHVYYYRKRAPAVLHNDEDVVADFPDEFADTIIAGATYLAMKERGDPNLASMEKSDYERLLLERISRTAVTSPDITRQVRGWGETVRRSSFPSDYPAVSR